MAVDPVSRHGTAEPGTLGPGCWPRAGKRAAGRSGRRL